MASWQVIVLAVLATVTMVMAQQVAQQTAASPVTAAQVQAAVAAATQQAPTTRQNAMSAGGILSGIASMMPTGFANMLPLVVLFGLGALMVPALGLGLLLREGRRSDHPYYYRSFPSFNINTSAIMDGMGDVFERVMKALDNVDKKYQ